MSTRRHASARLQVHSTAVRHLEFWMPFLSPMSKEQDVHEHGLKNRLKIGRFHKNRSVLLVFSKSVGEFEKF
jgi:hypothetical protein